jgi:Carboxypeptidase regulatory-like domain
VERPLGGRALRRLLVAALATCAGFLALPAGASALATISGQVYYVPPGCMICITQGIPNVSVAIKTQFDAPVHTVMTDATGHYTDSLYGGSGFDYHVYVSNLFEPISPATGEKDAHVVDAQTTTVNFSVRGSTITGNVWHDVDGDGVNDVGEPVVGGATVDVTGPASKQVATNGSGDFTTGSPVLPAGGYAISASKTGYDDGTATQVSPTAGQDVAAADHPMRYQTGTVTGHVYAETNGTPGFQAGEPPINGVGVFVAGTYDGNPFTIPGTSQPDGTFSIPGVFFGPVRTVTADQSPLYLDGAEFTSEVGPGVTNDQFTTVTVPANGSTGTFDFGETGATISGVTFSDRDQEGIKDANEPATGGRVIQAASAGFTATVTSAPDGTYTILGAPSEDITLTPDVTADALAPAAQIVHPDPGGTITGENFAFRFTSLSGKVLNRADGTGVAGVTVTLSGTATATTTSAADGSFHFFDLSPGTYALAATAPAGLELAASTVGSAGGAAAPGMVSGIGAGLGEMGTGYELGLAPPPSPPAPPGGEGGQTPGGGQPAGPTAQAAAKRVRIVAAKKLRVRKGRLKLGCKLDAGTIQSCSFVVVNKRGKALARGKAKARKPGTSLSVKLKLTKLGKKLLARSPKGLRGTAKVTATQKAGPQLKARKKLKLRRR